MPRQAQAETESVRSVDAWRRASKALCVAAFVAAGSSVLGWLWGGLLDKAGEPLMLVGFLVGFSGVVAAVVGMATDPGARRGSGLSRARFNPWSGVPHDLRRVLIAVAAVAAISAAVGLLSIAMRILSESA